MKKVKGTNNDVLGFKFYLIQQYFYKLILLYFYMRRSKGPRRKTRKKLCKRIRERGKIYVTRALQEFNIGDYVAIKIDPSVHKGMPHPRFHGRTGKVIERRGRAYIVEVRDGGIIKKVIALPEHLKPVEVNVK